MLETVGNPIPVFFKYTSLGVGATGLTVTCQVFKNRVRLTTGAPFTCIELDDDYAKGIYYYIIPAASVDTAGDYLACATAAGTCDQANVDAFWIAKGVLTPSLSAGSYLGKTLGSLVSTLRIWLNDEDEGNYTDAELITMINVAYMETVASVRSYKVRSEIAVVGGTHTYGSTGIFETLEVYYKVDAVGLVAATITELPRRTLGDVGVSIGTWDLTAAGTPTVHMPIEGGKFRVHPTPATTINHLIHYGLSVPTALAADLDEIVSLPEGIGATAVLTKAEYYCRKARSAYANNNEIIPLLLQNWVYWCNLITNALKGTS